MFLTLTDFADGEISKGSKDKSFKVRFQISILNPDGKYKIERGTERVVTYNDDILLKMIWVML